MRTFILFTAVLLLTVGCKPPPLSNDYRTVGIPLESETWASFAGEGTIALDRRTTDQFRLGYLATLGPKIYLLRSDGKYGGTMTCLQNDTRCEPSKSQFSRERRACAKGTNLSCHVFAIGDKIVWDGDVIFSDKAASAGASIVSSADFITVIPPQNASLSDEDSKYFGRGPLELGEGRVNNFLYYLKLSNPGFIIFPEEGFGSIIIKCPKGAGACSVNKEMLNHIANCKKAGGECMIFAKGRNIVWNGPIRFKKSLLVKKEEQSKASIPPEQERPRLSAPTGSKSKTFRRVKIKDMRDRTLCNYALAGGVGTTPRWSRLRTYGDIVQEAKDRGLSPEECLDKIFS